MADAIPTRLIGQDSGAARLSGGVEVVQTPESNNLRKMVSLGTIIESMSEGFLLLDSDFKIIEVNAEALRLDGRSRDELIGKTHWEAFPGTEKRLGELYKRAMRDKCEVALEHRYVWADGHHAWLEMRAFPIEGAGFAVFFRDVTERHENDQRRAQSEARFRAAIDATNGILWTNDATGKMTGEQPAWAELTGQTFDEYQAYGWSAAVHPEDAQPTIDAWNLAVAAREPFVFEHRVRRRDGAWRRFAIRAIPVFDSTGQIREWVGVHSDITEVTEKRLQLSRNAETFASLVRNNPFGIYVVDNAFRLIQFSEGAAKIFAGIEPLVGRDFAEILRLIWTEPFASEVIGRFRTTLETGAPYVSLNTIQPRGNIDVIEAYDWRIERIALPNGSDGVVCYFYDLSEHTRLEDELRQALTDKDLLAREIEHRVQNSLTIVSSLLSLQRSSARSTETKDALAAAALRVMALGRVHERLHKGTDPTRIEFDTYLRQLCDDIEQTLGRGDITFDVETDKVQLSVDAAVPLGIAANELITNACKYCCAGAPGRVIIRLEAQPHALVMTVNDTGPGVPDDFTPHGTKGLGLKAIKALVRQINGTIIFPQAGAEARFQITVPM